MVEWSNTPVLKTGVPQGTGGSNPSLSAKASEGKFRSLFSLVCLPWILDIVVADFVHLCFIPFKIHFILHFTQFYMQCFFHADILSFCIKTGYASIVPDIDKADTWGTIHQWADINAVARSIQDKCGSLDASGYISKKLLST